MSYIRTKNGNEVTIHGTYIPVVGGGDSSLVSAPMHFIIQSFYRGAWPHGVEPTVDLDKRKRLGSVSTLLLAVLRPPG